MKIITVNSSSDIFFPLEKEIFDDPNVIYHGTGSGFISKIEKDGWQINDLPYDVKDFVKVEQYYDKIGFVGFSNRGWVNFSFVEKNGKINRNKNPSFTSNYWTARNYSRNKGGEAIENLVTAIDDYILLANDTKKQDELFNKLAGLESKNFCDKYFNECNDGLFQCVLKNKLDEVSYSKYIQNFRDKKIKEIFSKIHNENYWHFNSLECIKIRKKYQKYLDSYPVIYVVRTNKHGKDLSEEFLRMVNIDIPIYSDILSDEIIFRIDFPNGIDKFKPYTVKPVCTWNIQEF